MPNQILTAKQRDKAVDCALRVTQAAIDGCNRYVSMNGVEFDLLRGGRCQEFVRECVEAGNKWPTYSWEFGDNEPSAKVASQRMRAAGHALPKGALLVPGDILTHERGTHGHIGLFVGAVNGVSTVCENTSSGTRGNPRRPGTKRTPMRDFSYTYAFRFVKPTAAGVFVGGRNVYPHVLLIDERAYVPRRLVAHKLGATLEPVVARVATVNRTPVEQIFRDGMGWMHARELGKLCGYLVEWDSPYEGCVNFVKAGGGTDE